jgi:hypothetical protein
MSGYVPRAGVPRSQNDVGFAGLCEQRLLRAADHEQNRGAACERTPHCSQAPEHTHTHTHKHKQTHTQPNIVRNPKSERRAVLRALLCYSDSQRIQPSIAERFRRWGAACEAAKGCGLCQSTARCPCLSVCDRCGPTDRCGYPCAASPAGPAPINVTNRCGEHAPVPWAAPRYGCGRRCTANALRRAAWLGAAPSRCRCGRVGPSPGADVAAVRSPGRQYPGPRRRLFVHDCDEASLKPRASRYLAEPLLGVFGVLRVLRVPRVPRVHGTH